MDYHNVPTTVFTPLEYGAIGFAEEDAISKYGEADIEVFHKNFWPLEWTVAHRSNEVCYAKLICRISENVSRNSSRGNDMGQAKLIKQVLNNVGSKSMI